MYRFVSDVMSKGRHNIVDDIIDCRRFESVMRYP